MDPGPSSLTALKQAAAAAAPALMWATVGCPFDVVKTRLQTATVPFASPLHCLTWTVRREGPTALWKGFVPQLLVSAPYSVIMFWVYDALKPQPASPDGAGNYIAGCFLAGAASGIAVTAFHNPLELWRVRLQTHTTTPESSGGGRSSGSGHSHGTGPTGRPTTGGVLRRLLRHPWQLGRGASMTLLENVVGNAVFFGSNELIRRQLAARSGGDTSPLGLSTEAVVGGLTGIVFQLVVYPADLIKARLMTQGGVQARQVARRILLEDGPRGFYRGASVTVLRACVINAAGWPALRLAKAWLDV